MKTCIIINPNAGSAGQADALIALAQQVEATCWHTGEAGEARAFAAQAAAEGYDLVAAAGGDGTVNEVVNGLMGQQRRPVLGIIPMGTGNDLARTLGLPLDPRDAFAILRTARTSPLDLIRVETGLQVVYGINAAAGGFSGQVGEQLTPDLKATWGPLAYLLGTVKALPDLTHHRLRLAIDDEAPEDVPAFNVLIANGRTVGGGKPVAPPADPQDGLLDLIVIEQGSALELAEVAARFVTGSYLASALVWHRRVRQVRVEAEPGMWFNVDGELLTKEPLTFTVVPGGLHVVVGPGFEEAAAGVHQDLAA